MRTTYAIDPSELPCAEWSRGGMLIGYVTAVATMIILMRLWYHALQDDPLATPIIVDQFVSIDLWSFVHVAIYAGVGFILPNHMFIGFVGGILFEVFEAVCAQTSVLDLKAFWEERGVNSAWDIFFNTVGFRLGQVLLVAYVYFRRKYRGVPPMDDTDDVVDEQAPGDGSAALEHPKND